MPETLRAFVGDGSIPPPRFYTPLIPIIGRSRQSVTPQDPSTRPARRGFNNPFVLFLYPDISLLLLFNAVVYAVFYGVTTSISTLFKTTYPYLSETEIGLCFLAIGGGMLIGGVVTGRVLDLEYRRVKQRMIAANEKETDPEKRLSPEDVTKEENFPIEIARLRLMPIYFGVFVVTCVGYGWTLEKDASIAAPLVLQFIRTYSSYLFPHGVTDTLIVGWAVVATMNVTQTLTVDLAPGLSASVTACVSLHSCKFSTSP